MVDGRCLSAVMCPVKVILVLTGNITMFIQYRFQYQTSTPESNHPHHQAAFVHSLELYQPYYRLVSQSSDLNPEALCYNLKLL